MAREGSLGAGPISGSKGTSSGAKGADGKLVTAGPGATMDPSKDEYVGGGVD